jgi:hypothetical protein
MLRLLLLFLIPSVPVKAVELLRDRHGSEYVFEPDQTEMTATVDAGRGHDTRYRLGCAFLRRPSPR